MPFDKVLVINRKQFIIKHNTFDNIIQISVHKFEDHCEMSSGLIKKYFFKENDIRMRGESSKSLNFS